MIEQRELTSEQIADLVRVEWDRRPNEMVGARGGLRFNRRVDHAVNAVARRLGLNWRVVLRAYRAKYPLRRPPARSRR